MSFIIVEGPNGSGKSTLIKNLNVKYDYKTLFSPGATELSSYLRSVCRGTDQWVNVSKMVQFLCFSAARYDEYEKIVAPLAEEEVVIADRWWTSTVVYQCWLQNIDIGFLEHTIHPNEKVDLVVCLGGDPNIFIKRVEEERQKNSAHKKCTWTQDIETQLKIADLYSKLPSYLVAKSIPVLEIDATKYTQDEVCEIVNNRITQL